MQPIKPAPSPWLVIGCTAILSLPFLIMGAKFAVDGIRRGDHFSAAFGGIFTLFALSGVLAAGKSNARFREVVARRRQYADQPWMWRHDWAERRVDEARTAVVGLWIFAVVWNAITWGVAYIAWRARTEAFVFLFISIFLLIGAVVLVAAIS